MYADPQQFDLVAPNLTVSSNGDAGIQAGVGECVPLHTCLHDADPSLARWSVKRRPPVWSLELSPKVAADGKVTTAGAAEELILPRSALSAFAHCDDLVNLQLRGPC
ncbi:hypothetical protein ACP70R_044375 [Stipagrostis hirtigluma subsp. patula]